MECRMPIKDSWTTFSSSSEGDLDMRYHHAVRKNHGLEPSALLLKAHSLPAIVAEL